MTCNSNAIQALVHNNEDEAILILRSALQQLKIWQKMDYKVNTTYEEVDNNDNDGGEKQQQHVLFPNTIIQETYMVKLPMLPSQSSSSSCSSSTVFNQAIQLCTTTRTTGRSSCTMNGSMTTLIPSSFSQSGSVTTGTASFTTNTTTTIAAAIAPKDIEMCTSVIIFNFAVSYHRKAIKLLSSQSSSLETTTANTIATTNTSKPTLAKAIATSEELYTMLLSYLDSTISILLGSRPTYKDNAKKNRSLVRTQALQEREVVPIAILLRLACVNNLLELKSSKLQQCNNNGPHYHCQNDENDEEEDGDDEVRDDSTTTTPTEACTNTTTANIFVDDVIEFWSSLWSTTTTTPPSSSTPQYFSSSPFFSASSSYASSSTVAPSPTPRWCYDYEKNIEYVNHGILNNLLHDPCSNESKLLYMMNMMMSSDSGNDDDDDASCMTRTTASTSTTATTTCCCGSNGNGGNNNFVRENLAMIAAFTYMMKPYVHPSAPFVQLISK